MGSEERLRRLGLSHLIDKPEELHKALREMIEETERQNRSLESESAQKRSEAVTARLIQEACGSVAAAPNNVAHRKGVWAEFRRDLRSKPIRTIVIYAFAFTLLVAIVAWNIALIAGIAYFCWTELPKQVVRHPFISLIVGFCAGLALGYYFFRNSADKQRDQQWADRQY